MEDIMDDQLKRQLRRFQAEQKLKSEKGNLLKNFFADNSEKYEDKLNAVKVTHKVDSGLFASAIKKMMKNWFLSSKKRIVLCENVTPNPIYTIEPMTLS